MASLTSRISMCMHLVSHFTLKLRANYFLAITYIKNAHGKIFQSMKNFSPSSTTSGPTHFIIIILP